MRENVFVRITQFVLGGNLVSWMIGANVRCKVSVPSGHKVSHHFIHRFANGWTGRDKYPRAIGTAPTLNMLYPNHLAGHA
jgi:hypothetical protein